MDQFKINLKERDRIARDLMEREGLTEVRAKDAANRILNSKAEQERDAKRAQEANVVKQRQLLVGESFVIPRGRFEGRMLSEMSNDELQLSWGGFNGSPKGGEIAAILKAEIDRRRANPGVVHHVAVASKPIEPAFTYKNPCLRAMNGIQTLTPWPDGFGDPAFHERGGNPPFEVDDLDEISGEFRAMFGDHL